MQAAKHGHLRRRLIIDKQLYTIPPPRGWLELESVIVKLADFCLSMLKTQCFYFMSTRKADSRYVRNVRRTSGPMDVRSWSTPGDAG
jgi:hypothetical protein